MIYKVRFIGGMIMATEAQKRAVLKYDAANTTQVHLKLNNKTDADILAWMEQQDNVQGVIKQLIRCQIGCQNENVHAGSVEK